MKLSVETYTLSKNFGDFKAIEIIKNAGFDAIDYSFFYEKEEVLIGEFREYAKKVKAHLDKVGLECNQAHAPFSLRYEMEKEDIKERYEYILRSIEFASILGAKNIVVHALTVPYGVDFEKVNLEFYKSFIPYLEKFNVSLSVENLFTRDTKRKRILGKLGSPEELNKMVEQINSPFVNACVDVGHASLTGFEPEIFIENMNPEYLQALHIQDTDYLEDKHLLPYLGELNWENIMKALKKVEYKGELTFEIVKYLEKVPEEMLPSALEFANKIGRYLISICEK